SRSVDRSREVPGLRAVQEDAAPARTLMANDEAGTIARKAARGAIWTIASSMGARAIGVLGTLVMTRFLHPSQIGEVSNATIIALTANWATIWGFGQYAVVKGRGDDTAAVTWHATVAYMATGAISLGLVALFGGKL